MLYKIAFGLVTVLSLIAGIVAVVEETYVASAFSFGSAACGAIALSFLIGRDNKHP